MPYFETCPACRSDDVDGNKKRDIATCNQCGYPAVPMSGQGFGRALSVSQVQRCHDLAGARHWVDDVENLWPAPIAHEYRRLRDLLRGEGERAPQIAGAIWQLKDVAEVLLKLPTLVLFRDLHAHSDQRSCKHLLQYFLEKPLAMGHWEQLSGRMAELALTRGPEQLVSWPIATLFRHADSLKPTALASLLYNLVHWRNQEIGHGAFRLDPEEHIRSLETWIPKLNGALAAHVGIWANLILKVEEYPGQEYQVVMTGWQALSARADRTHHEHSRIMETSLYVEGTEGRRVELGHYVGLRKCAECSELDIFFFDSYQQRNRRAYFLDYFRGHKIGLPDHVEYRIGRDRASLPTSEAITADIEDDGNTGAQVDHAHASVQALLEERQLQARTISPLYIRRPLEVFIEEHQKGVYWLDAPGHTGKTVFVADLVRNGVLPDCRVCAYHIKREYNCHPAQFAESLWDSLRSEAVLDLAAGRKQLPQLPLDASAPASAFAIWLGEMLAASSFRGKLLICIDGLDELPTPYGNLSIADYIPVTADLPERVYVLVTSRPERDCPEWLRQQLKDRLFADGTCTRHSIDPETNAPYHALMRDYFYAKLEGHWKDEIRRAVAQASQNSDGAVAGDALPDTFKTFAALEFKHQKCEDWPAVFTVFQRFEALFQELLEKAEHRFLFLAHLVDTLDNVQDWQASASIPAGGAMLTHFIGELRFALSEKAYGLAMRVLLALAAAEEAAARESRWLSTPPEWRGVPLSVLGAMLNEDAVSNRLVFVLYTLKSVLRSDKSDSAHEARFSLGLKEMSSILRELEASALADLHARLARQFLEQWRGHFSQIPSADGIAVYMVKTVMAHSDLGGHVQTIKYLNQLLPEIIEKSWQPLSIGASDDNDEADSIAWLDRIIEAQQRMIALHASGAAALKWKAEFISYRRDRYQAFRKLGMFNRAFQDAYQLHEWGTNEAELLRNQHIGLDTVPLMLEIAEAQQQLGWLLREDRNDYLEARHHSEQCLDQIKLFARMLSEQETITGAPKGEFDPISVRAHTEVAICSRHLGDRQNGYHHITQAITLLNNSDAWLTQHHVQNLLHATCFAYQELLSYSQTADDRIETASEVLTLIAQHVSIQSGLLHDDPDLQFNFASFHTELAKGYALSEQHPKAALSQEQAVGILKALQHHENFLYRGWLALALLNLAFFRSHCGAQGLTECVREAAHILDELEKKLSMSDWPATLLQKLAPWRDTLEAFRHRH